MKKHIFLNCTAQETRVAILESARLAELYIERRQDRSVVGNVYRGRVRRVLPGMQAAFVDVGFEKAAFLHTSDTHDFSETESGEVEVREIEEAEVPVEEDVGESSVRGIFRRVFGGVSGRIGVSGPRAIDPADDPAEEAARAWRRGVRRTPIEEKLRKNQDVIVQVIKEPIGTKGPRVTTFVSLAGRFLVYMPTTHQIGVSRRIEDNDERRRLRDLVTELRPPDGGFIVRTVCEGLSRKQIEGDIAFLTQEWERILEVARTRPAPSLLHQDMDQVQRTVRDLLTPDIGRVVIDSPYEFERVGNLVESLAPRLKGRVDLYEGSAPMFEHYGIEEQVDKALDRRVWLRSGGYLILEQTEALTAIDVNTGRYVGKKDQEETILKTNLEAAEELVRQLRLRNLGGLLIIDFIDMESADHRKKVNDALAEEVRKHDKAQSKILKISELGLVEMTRKRTRESLEKTLCDPCPHCGGTGRAKSPPTVSFEVLRKVRLEGARNGDASRLTVHANPAVASFLEAHERGALDEMEGAYHKKIVIEAEEAFAPAHFEIEAR